MKLNHKMSITRWEISFEGTRRFQKMLVLPLKFSFPSKNFFRCAFGCFWGDIFSFCVFFSWEISWGLCVHSWLCLLMWMKWKFKWIPRWNVEVSLRQSVKFCGRCFIWMIFAVTKMLLMGKKNLNLFRNQTFSCF